jgi:hypothetical protein
MSLGGLLAQGKYEMTKHISVDDLTYRRLEWLAKQYRYIDTVPKVVESLASTEINNWNNEEMKQEGFCVPEHLAPERLVFGEEFVS